MYNGSWLLAAVAAIIRSEARLRGSRPAARSASPTLGSVATHLVCVCEEDGENKLPCNCPGSSRRHHAGEDEVDSGEKLGAIVMHTQLPCHCASERVLLGVESFPVPRDGVENVSPVAERCR